ncbi:MAG: hypothetical protein AAB890_00745 [Patescibacteria group bacterium]
MQEDMQRVVDWLKEQPLNKELLWGSDHLSSKEPWATGWADINVPEMDRDVKLNWIWTIESSEKADPDDDGDIPVVYDLDVHRDTFRDNEIAVLKGQQLNTEQKLLLDEMKSNGKKIEMVGGWSADVIQKAIYKWISEKAGRPDIKLKWGSYFQSENILEAGLMLQDFISRN